MFQTSRPIIDRRGHRIIPSSAFMRVCVPKCISTCPDSRHIRENPFIIWTNHKRPGRWAFHGKRAAYGVYALATMGFEVSIPALVAHSCP